MNRVQTAIETFEGEGLKSAAEATLEFLGSNALGQRAIGTYAFGLDGRLEDSAQQLRTVIGSVELENPVMFGAGWDKKGRAVHGLHALGFSGGDVGTVLPFPQRGNDKPRLWTINPDHSVGLNRLGFNSIGMEGVARYLEKAGPLPCPIGINVGRNKEIENEKAGWAHAKVIQRLGAYADYFVLGISSPNTPDLRGLQDKEPFRDLIQAAYRAMEVRKDLYAKIDSERTPAELDDMIEVALEEGLTGFIATNTYMAPDLKVLYGQRWAGEMGGLSGNDPQYRERATQTVRHIYEAAGDRLTIIGVGGVNSADAAMSKITAGASAVQVVTAIRPSRGKVAADINRGLLEFMQHTGVTNAQELIGINTVRGVKAA